MMENEDVEDDPSKLKQLLLSKFGKIPDQFKAVVDSTGIDDILSSQLRYRYPWKLLWGNISKGNVSFAGDAFHPMTPDIGQGACSALEDGVVLARCLGEALLSKPSVVGKDKNEGGLQEYERIEMGLRKYAKERKWRAFDLVATSYTVGFVQQSTKKIINFLRDKVLASFLTQALLGRADFDCGKLFMS